ncbi:hypothetical protein F5Y05DRAFT_311245 [Hypoxylon sp. FL0543]|nr:hypothetical protein F5Y05DRAFT_311245 [Hypoxylon sp. FL0543]
MEPVAAISIAALILEAEIAFRDLQLISSESITRLADIADESIHFSDSIHTRDRNSEGNDTQFPIGKADYVELELLSSRSGLRKRQTEVNSPNGFSQRRKSLQDDSISPEVKGSEWSPGDQSFINRENKVRRILAESYHTFPDLDEHNVVGVDQDSVKLSSVVPPVESEGLRDLPEPESIEAAVSMREQPETTIEASHQSSWEYRRAPTVICEREKRTYTCFYLLAVVILLISASLAVSLWWSAGHGDVSGGFGIGSYMAGLSSTIVAVASYAHRSNCRCWKQGQSLPMWRSDNDSGDSNIVLEPYGHGRIVLGQEPSGAS